MSTQATTPKKAKTLYEWLPTDHTAECDAAKKKYEAEVATALETAKKTGKPILQTPKPFRCINVEGCCPDDVIVNAGISPLIVGAQAKVPDDSPRIDVGDRRQGPYYVSLLSVPGMVGLQPLKRVPLKRAGELEKIRKQRNGDLPQDWIVEARKRAADGGGPSPLDPRTELTPLQKAALGLAPD